MGVEEKYSPFLADRWEDERLGLGTIWLEGLRGKCCGRDERRNLVGGK